MKKMTQKLSIIVAVVLFSISAAFAQAPESMSYQAVIRDAGNLIVASKAVSMQISILKGSSSGTAIYVETQAGTTNSNGLVSFEIGKGTIVSGTVAGIDWSAGPYFIKTETDPAGGTSYSITGTSQLLSTPYSLYAKTASVTTAGMSDGHGTNVNCLECHNHNPATNAYAYGNKVANVKREIEHSKHASEGGIELAIEEGYSAGCAPCHSNEGFNNIIEKGYVPTYTLVSGKYTYVYNADAAASSALTTMPSTQGCFTCHKGSATDSMALKTTAAVDMCMYWFPGKTKQINLTQKGGIANLCVKCHQPRPMNCGTTATYRLADSTTVAMDMTKQNGASVDYADLATNPNNIFFDTTKANFKNNVLVPGYRTHNHYGTVGAVFAGIGAVEFTGTDDYSSKSTHSTDAACQDCHMAQPSGFTGGHSFQVSYVNSTGTKSVNFNGCNVTGCHASSKLTSTTSKYTTRKTKNLGYLTTLAGKLKVNGIELMHKNTDATSNPFAGVTTAGYDGYLDIYDPSTNPTGLLQNPVAGSSWTAANYATNRTKQKLSSLTNLQFGAIINFQMFLREFSLGVHNPAYSDAVMNNTIDALTAAGF